MKTERVWAGCPKFFRTAKFLTLVMVSIALVMTSCNKDDDDEGSDMIFLEGSPVIELPMYAMCGDVFEVTASGVRTPGVYYTWTYIGLDSLTVSGTGNCTIKLGVPDSLATYSITVKANGPSDEYYSSISTGNVVSVGEGSLTGVPATGKSFTDPRDGKVYGTVELGNLEWFAQNLNWEGAGEGYGKTEAGAYVFGRLYTWNDATGGESASGLGNGVQGVCPEGWSIPTAEDWVDLAMAVNGGEQVEFKEDWKGIAGKFMANAKFNGAWVWPYSPDVTPTNETGWSALAGGSSHNSYTLYKNVLSYGFWWSSTERDSNNAYYRYIYSEVPNFSANFSAKDGMGASVRCVRLKNN